MKFNKHYHQSVVDNYRDGFKRKFGIKLCLDDETIWNTYEEWFYCEDSEDATYDALREKHNAICLRENIIK